MACVLRIVFLLSAAFAAASTTARVVPGAVLVEDKSTLLYQSFVPVHFKITLPMVKSDFSVVDVKNCTDSGTLCELYQQTLTMARLVQQHVLDGNHYVRKADSNQSARQRLGGPEKIFGIASEGQIQELHVDVNNLERALDRVGKSIVNDHFTLMNVTKEINAFNLNMRRYMYSSTKNISEAFKAISTAEVRAEHFLGSTISNVALLLYNIEMATSMSVAAAECRSRLISRSLIPEATLVQRFASLETELKKFGWKMAATINQLLTLPVASCRYSDVFVHVQIDVPVSMEGSDLRLMKLTRLPFRFANQTCSISHANEHLVQDGDQVYSLPPSSTTCNLAGGHCMIRKLGTEISKFEKCARILTKGGTVESMAKSCVFECEDDTERPRIVDLGNGKVAITNANMIIQMCGKNATVIDTNVTVGTTVAEIPCHCELLVNRVISVPSQFPCSADVASIAQYEVQVPSLWLDLNLTKLDEMPETVDKYLDKLDTSWQSKIPHIQVETPAPLEMHGYLHEKVREAATSGFWSTVWLIILSIMVALLFLKAFMENFGAGLAAANSYASRQQGFNYAPAAMPFIPGVMGQDNKGNFISYLWGTVKEIEIGGIVMAMLWLLFATVCVIVIIKILRGVRHVSNVVDYLAEKDLDIEMQDRSSKRKGKK